MSTTVPLSKILIEGAKAIGIATIINVVLFFVLFAAKMIDPHVGVGPKQESLTIVPVVISTVMFSVVGLLIFLALVRFTANPVKIFTWVCIIGFVVTLGNPFFAGLPTTMGIALDLLHIAPAYLLWRFLTRAVA